MHPFLHTSMAFYRQAQHSVFCRENQWQAEIGTYRGDCSGLLLTLLEQYSSALFQEIITQYGPRPKAFQLYDWFVQPHANIERIDSLKDIEAGDILLWRKLNPPKSGDTGHTAIVVDVANECDASTAQSSRRLLVMDVSKQAHDNEDRSRPGLSCGWMSLTADSNFAVNGYIWSEQLKKAKRTEIVIARLTAI